MIGIFAGEDCTALEFRPVFASSSMRWAVIVIKKPLPDKYWGEWGIAFSRDCLWIYKKHESSPVYYHNFIQQLVKRLTTLRR